MKLTKARLRQIIKEEISALQNEPRTPVTEAYPDDAEAGLDSAAAHGFLKRGDPRLQLLDNAVEYFSDNIYQPPTDIDVEEFRYYYNIYQELRSFLTSIRGRRFASNWVIAPVTREGKIMPYHRALDHFHSLDELRASITSNGGAFIFRFIYKPVPVFHYKLHFINPRMLC